MEAAELDEEGLLSTIARSGVRALRFDDAWTRRTSLPYTPAVPLVVPCIDDMILTKRWSLRPKDVDDIAMLEKLKQGGGSKS